MPHIKKDALVIGTKYKLKARNLTEGVWLGDAFEGNRTKFGCTYLAKEYHWDDGPPFGTAKPIGEI